MTLTRRTAIAAIGGAIAAGTATKAESGIEQAQEAECAATQRLKAIVGEAMLLDGATPTTLALKADALTAWGEVSYHVQLLNPEAPKWLAMLGAVIREQV